MALMLMFLVLFGFGILFRYYTRETRCGWLTWVIPLGIYALGICADKTGIAQHKVGKDYVAGFSGTTSPHNYLQ